MITTLNVTDEQFNYLEYLISQISIGQCPSRLDQWWFVRVPPPPSPLPPPHARPSSTLGPAARSAQQHARPGRRGGAMGVVGRGGVVVGLARVEAAAVRDEARMLHTHSSREYSACRSRRVDGGACQGAGRVRADIQTEREGRTLTEGAASGRRDSE